MILPTKGLAEERALLTVGAAVISLMKHPMTVSEIWDSYKANYSNSDGESLITFDWLALTLAFLYSIKVLEEGNCGRLMMHHVPA